MKKFFTKYLPIPGQIEEGELCLVDDREGNVGILPYKKIYSEEDSLVTKVKLYLCSKDLREGDSLKECLEDQKPRKIDHFETVLPYGIWVLEDNSFISANRAYKVIGPISEDAIWVKDREEFDLKGLAFKMKLDASSPFYQKFEDVQDFEPGIKMCSEGLWEVGVKCSTCKTFH